MQALRKFTIAAALTATLAAACTARTSTPVTTTSTAAPDSSAGPAGTSTPVPTTSTPVPDSSAGPAPTASVPSSIDAVVAAAGDIACAPGDTVGSSCQHDAVARRIVADTAVQTVLALGDIQYEDGTLTAFQQSYDPTWGELKDKTRPVPGNHEYNSSGAKGYYAYFGAAAGDPTKGYYSFDVGAWHFVALNSEKDITEKGAQVRWLKADLQAHQNKCVAAYWHRPRWSSGQHGDNPDTAPFFKALYEANADLVLSGHDHAYERFSPLDASGDRDDTRGVTQIVSGLGGKSHYRVAGRVNTVTEDNTTVTENSTSYG